MIKDPLTLTRRTKSNLGCVIAFISSCSLAFTGSVNADTLRVPSQFPTIQAAINAANDGDVVSILAGNYFPGATLDTRGKLITIQGQENSDSYPSVTIDGQGSIVVLQCANGEGPQTRFENLVIANGYSTQEGGGMLITNGSSPTLFNCHFVGNVADCNGGAVANITTSDQDPCSPVFGNCTFEGNSTNCNGGAVYNDSAAAVFADCAFVNNSAVFGGALYDLSGISTMVNCTFNCNSATMDGGALYLDSLSVSTVVDCTFQQNRTAGAGGGIFFNSNSQSLQTSVLCGNIPDQTQGVFFNVGGNTIASTCVACPDVNGDGIVNGGDLSILLSSWGACTASTCPGDINMDGVVDGADFALVLSAWGPCSTCP